MIPAYLLLLLPLLGILYFGLLGHKEDVGKQNIRFNGVTLITFNAKVMAAEIYRCGLLKL
jgi:hydrogenase-4 component F